MKSINIMSNKIPIFILSFYQTLLSYTFKIFLYIKLLSYTLKNICRLLLVPQVFLIYIYPKRVLFTLQ